MLPVLARIHAAPRSSDREVPAPLRPPVRTLGTLHAGSCRPGCRGSTGARTDASRSQGRTSTTRSAPTRATLTIAAPRLAGHQGHRAPSGEAPGRRSAVRLQTSNSLSYYFEPMGWVFGSSPAIDFASSVVRGWPQPLALAGFPLASGAMSYTILSVPSGPIPPGMVSRPRT